MQLITDRYRDQQGAVDGTIGDIATWGFSVPGTDIHGSSQGWLCFGWHDL
jgi:hypothetical protein